MLNFTKEIILEPKWQKYYQSLRALLYALFFALTIVTIYEIIFPAIAFNYSVTNDTKKNSLSDPHDANNQTLKNEVLPKDTELFTDASLLGNFSNATINFTIKKNVPLEGSVINVRKSYRAFFYPTGNPMNFTDGNLLFFKGDFYLISNGEKHLFSTNALMQELGFTVDMFTMVDKPELDLNPTGTPIEDATYLDGTLFNIADNYYQLRNNKLVLFVSEKAFLSRYNATLALKKDADFLKKFELADTQIGLADGTLAAIGLSVSVLSDGKYYPIFDPQVFQEMGYNWDDVYQANSEELGIYKKQSILYQNAIHPEGTIFKDADSENYYLIKNNQKHPLIGTQLIASYLKIHPVIVNNTSLDNPIACTLQKNFFNFFENVYSCTMPIAAISTEKGNDYQISAKFNSAIQLDKVNLIINTAPTLNNARNWLSHIKATAISTYQNKLTNQ